MPSRVSGSTMERFLAACSLVGAFVSCTLICIAADNWIHPHRVANFFEAILAVAGLALAQLGQIYYERLSQTRGRTDPKSESAWREDLKYAKYLCALVGMPLWALACVCLMPFVWLLIRSLVFAL